MASFQGFSPDSFEQFIRALALDILGPGVTVFGNGPDGGREATFHGKVPFPFPPDSQWDGYGIIQAKFKERVESTQKDQKWAAAQLKAELELWKTSAKRAPRPEYFVFCTNVELSSAPNGGRAAAERLLDDYKSAFGLKGYAIWDGTQLAGYIDSRTAIRQRFNCFFTTGDLLAQFSRALGRVASPETVLTSYLAREILVDEDARLSQAGDRSEDRIRLASVFTDLPSSLAPLTEPPDADDGMTAASLQDLLRAAACKLDPLALYEESELPKHEARHDRRLYGRFVFLGGPGSGKSTLGQFLAQIHRAALLDRRPSHRLEPRVRNVIARVKARCGEENMAWPGTPRYPFRVELNAFAKALSAGAQSGVSSLADYLRKSLSGDFSVSHADMRDWLSQFPWLLVLDGLDEVPSSSNRREVITAIQNFLNEARDVEADLMIVASSRPDGYAGEFDSDEVAQRYLLPLSPARALACAGRYVSAKIGTVDDSRAMEAMRILNNAVENPLVARLMRSPLQVTFMVTVVVASGKPSESRWQLFNDYYRIIYERELHKAVRPFSDVLNERRQDIDALHHAVGFILQCRGEQSGGTQSDLSLDDFERMVSACLKENGLVDDDLARQTEMILGAAKLRLVFLTSRTPGKLSFDVRSLQEYMAAACITNGDLAEVMSRIEVIAHSAFWRNTLLFAIGRFFVEPHLRNHRDKIQALCDRLNRQSEETAAVKLGSRLALEILESGTVGNVPVVNRNLARCALELLVCPSAERDDIVKRLAEIYEPSLESEFKSITKLHLGQRNVHFAIPAWLVILLLERKGVTWAIDLAAEMWPEASSDGVTIFDRWLRGLRGTDRPSALLTELDVGRLRNLLPRVSLAECASLFELIEGSSFSEDELLGALYTWCEKTPAMEIDIGCGDEPSGMSVHFNVVAAPAYNDIFESLAPLQLEDSLHPDWHALLSLSPAITDPCSSNLAHALEVLAGSCAPKNWTLWSTRLPWPAKCCLRVAKTKEELILIATRVRRGEFGDTVDWTAKEQRWRDSGMPLKEFCSPVFRKGPELALAVTTVSVGHAPLTTSSKLAEELLDALIDATGPAIRDEMCWILAFYGTHTGSLGGLDPIALQEHLIPARERWHESEIIVNPDRQNSEGWLTFYDCYGRSDNLSFRGFSWRSNEYPVVPVLNGFKTDTSRLGLLRLAGFWCAGGTEPKASLPLTLPSEILEPKFRLAAILVRILSSELTPKQSEELATFIPSVLGEGGEPDALRILLKILERNTTRAPIIEPLVAELAKVIVPDDRELQARLISLQFMLLQSHHSGFDEVALRSLGLPSLAAN